MDELPLDSAIVSTETAIIEDMGLLKDWMQVEYATLTKAHDLLERQHSSLSHSYHYKRLELIKVARTIGLELAPPSYERKMKIEGANK